MIEARTEASATISGADLAPYNRAALEAVALFRARDNGRGRVPYVFLQFAITVNRLVNGSAAEPRNMPASPDPPSSDQPAQTFPVREAASRMEVSESYVRRLVRHGILEVQPGQGPTRIYADSVAAHQERRERRKETEREAA